MQEKCEKNRKRKSYHYNGDLTYDSEYLNGEKNGEGKEYNALSILIFEGKYKKDKRWKGKKFDGFCRRKERYIFEKKLLQIK